MPINNPKRVRFKHGTFRLKENPRRGICSQCHKKIGDEYTDSRGQIATIKRTHMHHSLGYFIIFKWFGLIELCNSCHPKKNMSDRSCHLCHKSGLIGKTKGYQGWHRWKGDKWICIICYIRERRKNNKN